MQKAKIQFCEGIDVLLLAFLAKGKPFVFHLKISSLKVNIFFLTPNSEFMCKNVCPPKMKKNSYCITLVLYAVFRKRNAFYKWVVVSRYIF